MHGGERVVDVIREWVAKAENDLTTAVHTLKLGETCPTDTVVFHAQQCVEKYLKALLLMNMIDFPKTHDLSRLMSLLAPSARPHLTAEEQARLTEYATAARYPEWPDISLADARRAIAIARRVRKEARSLLPRKAIRRTKRKATTVR